MKIFYAKGISTPGLFPITSNSDNDTKNSSFKEDVRTLFWSGNYFKDRSNNVITFYSNNISANYKVTVTGISSRGDLIYKTMTFQTK